MSHEDDWLPWGIDRGEGGSTPYAPEVDYCEPEPIGVIWLPDNTAIAVWPERPPFGFVSGRG